MWVGVRGFEFGLVGCPAGGTFGGGTEAVADTATVADGVMPGITSALDVADAAGAIAEGAGGTEIEAGAIAEVCDPPAGAPGEPARKNTPPPTSASAPTTTASTAISRERARGGAGVFALRASGPPVTASALGAGSSGKRFVGLATTGAMPSAFAACAARSAAPGGPNGASAAASAATLG